MDNTKVVIIGAGFAGSIRSPTAIVRHRRNADRPIKTGLLVFGFRGPCVGRGEHRAAFAAHSTPHYT